MIQSYILILKVSEGIKKAVTQDKQVCQCFSFQAGVLGLSGTLSFKQQITKKYIKNVYSHFHFWKIQDHT